MKETGGPAFPQLEREIDGQNNYAYYSAGGMPLRVYAAIELRYGYRWDKEDKAVADALASKGDLNA